MESTILSIIVFVGGIMGASVFWVIMFNGESERLEKLLAEKDELLRAYEQALKRTYD